MQLNNCELQCYHTNGKSHIVCVVHLMEHVRIIRSFKCNSSALKCLVHVYNSMHQRLTVHNVLALLGSDAVVAWSRLGEVAQRTRERRTWRNRKASEGLPVILSTTVPVHSTNIEP